MVLEALEYCQKKKGLEIYAWVLMTNHLHMIIGAESIDAVHAILRDFKKFTSKRFLLNCAVMMKRAGGNGC